MKFGRFLNKVQKMLQFQVEFDLRTVKRIIILFEESLSEKQQERWATELEMIKSYKSVQTILPE